MHIQILSLLKDEWEVIENNTKEALQRLNKVAKVEIVNDAFYLMACGVLKTPVLVVNGKIKSKGKVMDCDEIIQILNNH